MLSDEIKKASVIIYSTLFIFFSSILLIKTSSVFFILFSLLPLFLIGLSTSIVSTLVSYSFSLFLLTIFLNVKNNSMDNDALNYFFFNLFIIFISAFFITSCLKFKEKKTFLSAGNSFSCYILFISVVLITFLKFFYLNIDTSANIEEIKTLYFNNILIQNAELKSQIELLINMIYKILPAINGLVFLSLTFANLVLSLKILNNYNMSIRPNIFSGLLVIPNWYFYLTVLFFVLFFFSSADINLIALNTILLFSSIFIANGLTIILRFFKKKKIHNSLKFLLLFLLFIFFSYLLLLFLFILGFYQKIKELYT